MEGNSKYTVTDEPQGHHVTYKRPALQKTNTVCLHSILRYIVKTREHKNAAKGYGATFYWVLYIRFAKWKINYRKTVGLTTKEHRESVNLLSVALQVYKLSKCIQIYTLKMGNSSVCSSFNKVCHNKRLSMCFVCPFCDWMVTNNRRSWKASSARQYYLITELLHELCFLGMGRDWVGRKQTGCATG